MANSEEGKRHDGGGQGRFPRDSDGTRRSRSALACGEGGGEIGDALGSEKAGHGLKLAVVRKECYDAIAEPIFD